MGRTAARSLLALTPLAALAVALNLPEPAGRMPQGPQAVAPSSSGPAFEGPTMEVAPAEAAHAGEVRADNGLGMAFRRCPPGSFRMGRGRGAVRATLTRGYWMGQFEVTQSQWMRLMGLTLRQRRARDPGQPRPLGDGSTRDHAGEGFDHPIDFVNHADAAASCRAMDDQERHAGRVPEGYADRLPTEAQWEFASRAGTSTATAFGDRLGSHQANFDGTKPHGGAAAGPYRKEVLPVGRFPPNAWGLHDMHGNLVEWCLDGDLEALPGGVAPVSPLASPFRASRGGCWDQPGGGCLSTTRARCPVGDEGRGSGMGFRVALVPVGP